MKKLPEGTLEVRACREDDFPAIVAFVAMIQEYEREVESNRRLGGLIAVPYAHHIKSATSADDGVMLMACISDAPVGFIAAYPETDADELIEEKKRKHGYVSDMFVLPNWRRMGVGSKMLSTVEAHFRARGIERLRINGVSLNKAALGLYERYGFRSYEVMYEKNIPQTAQAISDSRRAQG